MRKKQEMNSPKTKTGDELGAHPLYYRFGNSKIQQSSITVIPVQIFLLDRSVLSVLPVRSLCRLFRERVIKESTNEKKSTAEKESIIRIPGYSRYDLMVCGIILFIEFLSRRWSKNQLCAQCLAKSIINRNEAIFIKPMFRDTFP